MIPTCRPRPRHEAAHAAAAQLLGWRVTEVEPKADGGGNCEVLSPADLDEAVRQQQFAGICFASRAHVGWTADDGDRGDRWNAYKAIRTLTSDPFQAENLRGALQQARELETSSRFRWIAKRVAEALLERGRLGVLELAPLLAEASREGRRLECPAA